jgi:transcription-repair coupling factor (superfamily II helicase)
VTFRRLAQLVAEDPAIIRLIGRASTVLAVPDPARAMALAGLALASERRPVLVALPTTGEAERLWRDLSLYLGRDDVLTYPAWETLPFERVSPSIETMGTRLRTIWHLQDPERCPKVVLSSVRALIQRLSPHVEDLEPLVVGAGDQIDLQGLVNDLIGFGYRREHQVEHRGELAVRGSILDVFPSTADGPVRIDLWGDEVDRLCEFTVNDQRSTIDLAEIEIFPCRELMVSEDIRKRAAELESSEPWGREHWQRLADGELFEGMESWLPWLTNQGIASDDEGAPDGARILPDLLGNDALIVLVEPRRMRDRATDLLHEEADLAASLARTWGVTGSDVDQADPGASPVFPRLHLPFERLLARTSAPTVGPRRRGDDSLRLGRPG